MKRINLLLPVFLVAFATFTPAMQVALGALVPIDPSNFAIPDDSVYCLDSGDTLGIFVEGVLGEPNSMPPIHDPPPGSRLPPAMGFPTLVLHDGTIRLPLVEPIPVRGQTVSQVEGLLKKTYRGGDQPIIKQKNRIIVSLIRQRTVDVIVVREDQSQAQRSTQFQGRSNQRPVSVRSDRSGRIYKLQLPAGENDLLNAMIQSGGIPGVNAKDNLQVFRRQQQKFDSTSPFPRTSDSPGNAVFVQSLPIRTSMSESPFPRSGTRLDSGDVVSITAKRTEVFYTAGLLGGGEYLIPRDRPLSVMEAISIAGGIPQSTTSGAIPLQEPRVLRVLRNRNGNQQVLSFDVSSGFSGKANQTTVQPGDYLILDFSPSQRIQNIGIGTFNTFGLRQLFGN